MGFMTLEQFRREVHETLGVPGLRNERIDTWVNLALYELTGAKDFYSLDYSETIPTQVGVTLYPFTGKFMGVDSVTLQYELENYTLVRASKSFFFSRNEETTGRPKIWLREGLGIRVWPKPDAIYSLLITGAKEPDPIIAEGETSGLPATWDQAILGLSIAIGLWGFGEYERASAQYARTSSYIRSRLDDGDREDQSVTMPTIIARNLEDLRGIFGGTDV
jgi:hypothetical protein